MFQFRRFPLCSYGFTAQYYDVTHSGLLHSDILGSMSAYDSPKHFVVCHVLLRLLMPRHSPCALLRLTLWSFCFSHNVQILVPHAIKVCWRLIPQLAFFEIVFTHHYFLVIDVRNLFLSHLLLSLLFSFQDTCHNQNFFRLLGGLKWTRTTDLTLIRRAL